MHRLPITWSTLIEKTKLVPSTKRLPTIKPPKRVRTETVQMEPSQDVERLELHVLASITVVLRAESNIVQKMHLVQQNSVSRSP